MANIEHGKNTPDSWWGKLWENDILIAGGLILVLAVLAGFELSDFNDRFGMGE